jgi:ribosomal protein S18 acetylase RimI-like enzyme
MTTEIRRIARNRFSTEYWPAIDAALQTCLESHSVVITCPSNDDKQIAAFVLVCPPTTSSKTAYGIEQTVPSNVLEIAGSVQDPVDQSFLEEGCSLLPKALEIAFVATDEGWEGCGFARTLLEAVLFRCTTAQQSAWLHVDTINQKAHAFYERLGFRNFLHIPDPYGSPGFLMLWSPRRNHQTLEWTTLFNAPPCETEQPFGRSILAPPSMTCA